MRIISKFHDYYDTAMTYGQDQDVKFIRNYRPLNKEEAEGLHVSGISGRLPKETFQNAKCRIDVYPIAVLVCGKEYRGLRVINVIFEPEYKIETNYFYDFKNFDSYLRHYKFYLDEKVQGHRWLKGYRQRKYKDLMSWFDDQGTKYNEKVMIEKKISLVFFEPFADNRAPEESAWDLNPCLKNVQFYKVMDPFTLYQELSMWVGGVLPQPSNPTVEIEDKYKIVEHGFNKWSFRKQSPDKVYKD